MSCRPEAALGAEVRGIDLKQLDDATFKTIHESWLHHLLLVFRGQSLAAEDLVKLVRRFGTPVTSSNLHKRSLDERAANRLYNLPPEVTVVSNVQDQGKSIGILGDGEVVWHSDFSFKERPTAARMLVAMEVPPRELGGNTLFLNCYAAYDALPEEYEEAPLRHDHQAGQHHRHGDEAAARRIAGRGRADDAGSQPPGHLHASRDRRQHAVPRPPARRLRQRPARWRNPRRC